MTVNMKNNLLAAWGVFCVVTACMVLKVPAADNIFSAVIGVAIGGFVLVVGYSWLGKNLVSAAVGALTACLGLALLGVQSSTVGGYSQFIGWLNLVVFCDCFNRIILFHPTVGKGVK